MSDILLQVLVDDVRELRRDVRKLLQFRGWVLGAAAAVGTLASLAVGWMTGR